MTTIAPRYRATSRPAATTESRAAAMFTRLVALFAAAGRAVPFHAESTWQRIGSSGIHDRDLERASLELRAIASVREHG